MRSYKDIPTALSPAETNALQQFGRGLKVVEAGSLLGYSTLALAETAAQVIAIDRHVGYGPSTLSQFMSNTEGRYDKIVPVIADAAQVIDRFLADRYFLDLDGTYDTTRAVLNALPYTGVLIAIHDFGRSNCEGVTKAVLDAGLEIDRVVDTLAFCRKRG